MKFNFAHSQTHPRDPLHLFITNPIYFLCLTHFSMFSFKSFKSLEPHHSSVLCLGLSSLFYFSVSFYSLFLCCVCFILFFIIIFFILCFCFSILNREKGSGQWVGHQIQEKKAKYSYQLNL